MKIWKEHSKREKRDVWRARFESGGKTKRLRADSKRELENLIAEVKRQSNIENVNRKHNTDIATELRVPSVRQVFDEMIPDIKKHSHRTLTKRVATVFLSLLDGGDTLVTDLKSFHFQKYINERRRDINNQSGKVVTAQTINKEIAALRAILRKARFSYPDLETWNLPPVQMLPEKDNARDLNLEITDFYRLLDKLREPRQGKQSYRDEVSRKRLADELEFRLETGLRRKEVARLEFRQYKDGILRNVRRFKTDTVTKVFPLSQRAIEIVEARRLVQGDCSFIFTRDGETVESAYRTLKRICRELNIPYGRYETEGFIGHDLRHHFASKVIEYTDIETARELMAHADIKMTQRYLHTNPQRLKDAVRRFDKVDIDSELTEIFEQVKDGKLSVNEFIEKVKRLFG